MLFLYACMQVEVCYATSYKQLRFDLQFSVGQNDSTCVWKFNQLGNVSILA